MQEYYNAHEKALKKKKITISRIFVIPTEITQQPNELEILVTTLRKHIEMKIPNVRIGFYEEINAKMEDFSSSDYGNCGFHLHTSFLIVDNLVHSRFSHGQDFYSIKNKGAHSVTTWDGSCMEVKRAFEYLKGITSPLNEQWIEKNLIPKISDEATSNSENTTDRVFKLKRKTILRKKSNESKDCVENPDQIPQRSSD